MGRRPPCRPGRSLWPSELTSSPAVSAAASGSHSACSQGSLKQPSPGQSSRRRSQTLSKCVLCLQNCAGSEPSVRELVPPTSRAALQPVLQAHTLWRSTRAAAAAGMRTLAAWPLPWRGRQGCVALLTTCLIAGAPGERMTARTLPADTAPSPATTLSPAHSSLAALPPRISNSTTKNTTSGLTVML